MSKNDTRHAKWTDRFSDYLSGDLSSAEFLEVETHLDGCGACRATLAELRAVIDAAHGLQDLEPPRDLWGGIAATIGAPVPAAPSDDTKVIALPTAASAGRVDGPRRRGVFFTTPQMLAASIALIAASAFVTWSAGSGLGVRAEGPVTGVRGSVSMVSAEAALPAGMADELEALEDALAQLGSRLDPNTVRVLDRNLGVIQQAIEDSRRALAQDPGNEFLASHLERVYQRKLEYLRDAAQVAEWAD